MPNNKQVPVRPRIGIRIPACTSIDKVAEAIVLAEQLGFDSAWLPDSQLIWRDTWMALALAATKTRHITLGTAVTNVVTRHASVIASATRTLQELTPERFALGLGIGWSSAGMVGLPPTKHDEFVEAIHALHTLLSGGKAQFGGIEAELTGAAGPCPIYLGTQGPRNLRYAGAVADGVIVAMALAPGLLEQKLSHLRSGALAAGRQMEDIDVAVWAPAHVTEDLAGDLKLFKPTVAIALRNQPADELAAAGIQVRLAGDLPAGFEPDGSHVADWDVAVAACDAIVSDDLARRWVEAFAVVGSAETLPARLRGIAERGVNTLMLTPLASDSNQALPTELMKTMSQALGLPARD